MVNLLPPEKPPRKIIREKGIAQTWT